MTLIDYIPCFMDLKAFFFILTCSATFCRVCFIASYFISPHLTETRPAWAGFKTAEEGRAKICKFLWQKLKNKSNIKKHIMNNFITLLEQF